MECNYSIQIATLSDFDKWMKFTKTVQYEFHGIDLVNTNSYREAILKNIKRSTAIYVAEEKDSSIIGGLIYSMNSNHIGWLAVNPQYRKKGIGTLLIKYVFKQFPKDTPIEVKTFLETDKSGLTAQSFYKSLGFIAERIVEDRNNENGGKPFHVFMSYNR